MSTHLHTCVAKRGMTAMEVAGKSKKIPNPKKKSLLHTSPSTRLELFFAISEGWLWGVDPLVPLGMVGAWALATFARNCRVWQKLDFSCCKKKTAEGLLIKAFSGFYFLCFNGRNKKKRFPAEVNRGLLQGLYGGVACADISSLAVYSS